MAREQVCWCETVLWKLSFLDELTGWSELQLKKSGGDLPEVTKSTAGDDCTGAQTWGKFWILSVQKNPGFVTRLRAV